MRKIKSKKLSKSNIKHEKKLSKTTKHEEKKVNKTRSGKETEMYLMIPSKPKLFKKKNEPSGSFSRNTEKHTYIILWQNPQKDRNCQPCTLFLPSLPFLLGIRIFSYQYLKIFNDHIL
jgi:hypothetical protein